jgi:hypothetical protein
MRFTNSAHTNMKNNNSVTIVAVLILVVAFSLWNINFTEAKQNEGEFSPEVSREILWLARIIYSETKEANEQVLVAWVARNRVETAYRGRDTYHGVAIDKGQFSGLNPRDNQYLHNISRSYVSRGESWDSALEIAEAVYSSSGYLRPFSKSVRHFYSPRAVRFDPKWAADHKPALVIRDSSEDRHVRFAFYDGIK